MHVTQRAFIQMDMVDKSCYDCCGNCRVDFFCMIPARVHDSMLWPVLSVISFKVTR